MSTFNFSPLVLDWAARNIGVSWNDLADEIITAKQKREEKLNAAYAGLLTISQAEKVSKLTSTPFGYLFLKAPPQFNKPSIPDLRTVQNSVPLSNNFYDTLEDTQKKIDWYKDYLKEIDALAPLPFVKRFTLNKKLSFEIVAQDIKETIGFDEDFLKHTKKESYYNKLSALIEDVGIFVFTNGVVKNSSNKKLDTSEFRGFAIADTYTPAVFINNSDALSAQLFTLMHEVAHIWIGESGVSEINTDNDIEKFCNKVAAEFLMPSSDFLTIWEKLVLDDRAHFVEHIESIANTFMVSHFAAGIKAFHLKLISQSQLNEIRTRSTKTYNSRSKSSGGNFYATLPVRNSKKLLKTIVNQAMSQKIMLREAASLLNTKPDTIVRLYLKQENR